MSATPARRRPRFQTSSDDDADGAHQLIKRGCRGSRSGSNARSGPRGRSGRSSSSGQSGASASARYCGCPCRQPATIRLPLDATLRRQTLYVLGFTRTEQGAIVPVSKEQPGSFASGMVNLREVFRVKFASPSNCFHRRRRTTSTSSAWRPGTLVCQMGRRASSLVRTVFRRTRGVSLSATARASTFAWSHNCAHAGGRRRCGIAARHRSRASRCSSRGAHKF